MKPEQLDALRQRLLEHREELMERIAQQRGGHVGRAQAAAEQFNHSEDAHAQNMTERDLSFAIDEHESAELNGVQAALVRIREGSFGDCVDCGQTIALPRLKATPEVERCLDCQTLWEKKHPY